MGNSIKDELSVGIERDKILLEGIEECDKLLSELSGKRPWWSICNNLFVKLKLQFRLKEEKCTDGQYTNFDADDVFMNDLKKAVSDRKKRIEEHASKFIRVRKIDESEEMNLEIKSCDECGYFVHPEDGSCLNDECINYK